MLENIQTMKTENVEKKLVDKLVEKCTENVEEVRLAKIISAEDENKHKCSSSTLYTVFFFNTCYIQRWNWYLFCLYSLVQKE